MQHNHKKNHQVPHIPTSTSPKTPEEWVAHWKAQGQDWRIEPEISIERQAELTTYRTIDPNIEKGKYPFHDVKLNRADIEWLLATHENGLGPVIWSDESQRTRKGINLRGADMRQVDLRGLPLACLIGGPTKLERDEVRDQPRNIISIHMEQADLRNAHLEGAMLNRAHLEGASLGRAHLEVADLVSARLEHARLRWTNLEGAILKWAHLDDTSLRGANLAEADLTLAHFKDTHLEETIIWNQKHISPKLADAYWEGTNLSVVNWLQVEMLGDESIARQKIYEGKKKDRTTRLEEHLQAARANRQLAMALQAQGLIEDAARFTYRAQILQKEVLWFQVIQDDISLHTRVSYLGSWLFSWFIFLIAGYGYKFGRSLLTYILVICGFAIVYYLLGVHDIGPHNIPGPHHLSWYEAFIVSMTAFHGRGFFVGTFSPADPQAGVAALEAFLGLLIEVTFIATLTQRLFSR